MITFSHSGDFKKINNFLQKIIKQLYILKKLHECGERGVQALSAATPVDTGKTSMSWSYEIETTSDGSKIIWRNSNENKGVNIALILQYGHGTGTGGWVEGIDYINPALKPIFDEMIEDVWREVTD